MRKTAQAIKASDFMPGSKPAPFAESVEILNANECPQGGSDWLRQHIGIPSASNFATIMASGKDGGESIGRRKLLYRMAGEIITGEPAETYRNSAMDRGKEMEPEACGHYSFTRGVELDKVGFVIRNLSGGRRVGCSPDRLIGKDGMLETKTMMPELLIEMALKGAAGFPPEHRAQIHGGLWVTDRQWCDLLVYYRGMPVAPTFRIERSDPYIRQIAEAVEVFDHELKQLVIRVRSLGK